MTFFKRMFSSRLPSANDLQSTEWAAPPSSPTGPFTNQDFLTIQNGNQYDASLFHRTSYSLNVNATEMRQANNLERDWKYSESPLHRLHSDSKPSLFVKRTNTGIASSQTKSSSQTLQDASSQGDRLANLEAILIRECVFDMHLLGAEPSLQITMALMLPKGHILLATSQGSVLLLNLWTERCCGIRDLHSKSLSAWRVVEHREVTRPRLPSLSLYSASWDKSLKMTRIVPHQSDAVEGSYVWDTAEGSDRVMNTRDHSIRCICEVRHACDLFQCPGLTTTCPIGYHLVTGGVELTLWSRNGERMDKLGPQEFDHEDVVHLLSLERDSLIVCAFLKHLCLVRVRCLTNSLNSTQSERYGLQALRRLAQHQEPIRALVPLHASSCSFLSASLDGAIHLWSGFSSNAQGLFNAHHDYIGPMHGFPFSVQSVQVMWNRLLLCSVGTGFALFEISVSYPLLVVHGAHSGVKTTQVRYILLPPPKTMDTPLAARDSLAQLPATDGQPFLVSCGEDGDIRLWEVADRKLTEFTEHSKNSSLPRWIGGSRRHSAEPSVGSQNKSGSTANLFFLGLSVSALMEKVSKQGGRPLTGILQCRKELRGHRGAISELLVIPDDAGFACGFLTCTENHEVAVWRLRSHMEELYLKWLLPARNYKNREAAVEPPFTRQSSECS